MKFIYIRISQNERNLNIDFEISEVDSDNRIVESNLPLLVFIFVFEIVLNLPEFETFGAGASDFDFGIPLCLESVFVI